MAQVTVVFIPECPPPEGFIPSIDIQNPRKASERYVPDLITVDGPNGELFGFEMDELAAKKLLYDNCHCYKLWEPEVFKIMVPAGHGAQRSVELKSVNPAYAPKAKAPVTTPSTGSKKKVLDSEVAAAAAAAAAAEAA